jgi:ABC-type sugar transport system substrate-binding protein
MTFALQMARWLLSSCLLLCTLSPQVTSAAPAPHYVIGFSQCTMNDAWRQAMLAGMKKELSFYPNVEFRLKDAHDNSTVQQQQLHEFLQENIELFQPMKQSLLRRQ